MRPLVGRSKPAIIRSVVVLPQPDGPTIVKNSPGGMSRSMPSTATTSAERLDSASSRISPSIPNLQAGGDASAPLGAGEAPVDDECERERQSVITSVIVASAFSAGVGAPRAEE